MRKFLILVATFVIIGILLCGCSGVSVHQSANDLTYANIYREAATLGYEGTLSEFIRLVSGADGNGISDLWIDSEGFLVVSYTNSLQELTIGRVKGEKGDTGADGVSITCVELNENGELLVTLSSDINNPINLGKVLKADAINGINGVDGIDGTNGTDGIDGANGTNGTNGIDGANGIDGLNGTNGTNGIDGANGTNGTNGKSAYEIYRYYYPEYTKSEKEWLLDFMKGNLVPRYNITFYFYEGKENEMIEVLEADKIIAPLVETTDREGYNFICWRAESIVGDEYDFNAVVDSDLNLYAVYEKSDPILEDKGIITSPATIAIESLYKYSLIKYMTSITFYATQGSLEYEIFDSYDNIMLSSNCTFSASNNNLTVGLTDYTDMLENTYIIISYRGESGLLSMYFE